MPNPAARDDGLRKISSLTRWVAAGAIVVAGVFSAVAARAVPGKSKVATQPASAAGGGQDSPPTTATDGGASDDNGGLVPPVQAPQPSQGYGSVSSGAS